LESKEQRDLKDQKELKVHPEKLVLLDHQGKREKKDRQDLLDIQEDQEIKETKVLREEMVHLVEKEKGGKTVSKERGVRLGQEGSEEE
jgi:hypothetical protein